MKTSLAIIVFLLAPLGLAACRSADRPPLRKGEPMTLQLRLPADSAHWVEASFRDVGRYGFLGEEIRIEGFTRFVYELRTVQRSRTGDTQFVVTPRIYAVQDQVVTPRGERDRPPAVEELFQTMEAVIRLHPFQFTVGAGGGITHSEGLVELENALAGAITRAHIAFDDMEPRFRHAWRRVFMAHIDERPIRRHIQQTYGFLPDGPVRLGDKWAAPDTTEPWPFLPVEKSTRLINREDGRLYLLTTGAFDRKPGSGDPRYEGGTRRQIYVEPDTGLGVQQQARVFWQRKRKRTPWEQFTLKSLEGSATVRIEDGPIRESPDLFAIHRFPFMEAVP